MLLATSWNELQKCKYRVCHVWIFSCAIVYCEDIRYSLRWCSFITTDRELGVWRHYVTGIMCNNQCWIETQNTIHIYFIQYFLTSKLYVWQCRPLNNQGMYINQGKGLGLGWSIEPIWLIRLVHYDLAPHSYNNPPRGFCVIILI